jgi:hypothetical protein
MKNNQQKKMSKNLGLFVRRGSMLVASAFLMWGCSKGNDSASNPTPLPPASGYNFSGCQSCAGLRSPQAGLVGVRSSTVDEKVLLSFDLIVDGGVSSFNYANPKFYLFYRGPVVLQGTLRVVEPNNFEVCGAPVGDYVLRPLNIGQSMDGTISGGTYEAVGPARMIIRTGSSSVYNAEDPNGVSRNSPTNRINLNAYIDYVNNVPCGPLSTR